MWLIMPMPQVCVWDVRRCEVVKVLEGHKGAVFAVEMDDATETVFSGSRDNVSVFIGF